MQHVVAYGAYFLACLIALLAAARWIARNHPALRDVTPPRADEHEDSSPPEGT
ncbi:hypothetical protein LMG26411_07598 [Cupriavidus numazuensis]|uniref:Heme exporter protein D n=1 Tax=Cupriavidus numazuensis TaxID=221992 RepID=A0ABN7QE24_9BURK|nr:hypothetical protein LMG26411_07598 [Cupriavidus numazuensis]